VSKSHSYVTRLLDRHATSRLQRAPSVPHQVEIPVRVPVGSDLHGRVHEKNLQLHQRTGNTSPDRQVGRVPPFVPQYYIVHVDINCQYSRPAGTYEKVEEEEEEIYEVINVHKLKSATPNLRVINLYGINFIDDSHIDAFSSNCIQLECLAVNYCSKVTGSTMKTLFQRSKRLRCLLMNQTSN